METKRRALGKGLEELFNSESLEIDKIEEKIMQSASKEEIVELNLDELRRNPYQPRKNFDEASLIELSESIKTYGVFQPIIVKQSIRGYEIIAGERRARASKMAGLITIPAIIRDFSDEQMMQIALIENLQREDLTAIEEANAYKNIISALQITQDELAVKIGKSRSHITNMLGLLGLPIVVQNMLLNREISMGHARVLSKLNDPSQIEILAKRIVSESLSVRNLESIVDNSYKRRAPIIRQPKNPEYKSVEEALEEKFDSKVIVSDNKILIKYSSKEDLNRILEILEINIE
jgi:ParB family chromosome partitioning protein